MTALTAAAAASTSKSAWERCFACCRARCCALVRSRWTLITLGALLLSLVVELFVFNYSVLFFDEERYPHQVIILPQHPQLQRPLAVLSPQNKILTLTEVNLPVKTVYLQMGYGGRTLLRGQLYLKDDARAYAYSPVASFALVPIAERDDSGINPLTGAFDNDGCGSPQEVAETYLQIWPHGRVHELRLELPELHGEVGIMALELNKPLPVDISVIRVVMLTGVLLLIYTLARTTVRQQVIAVASRRYRVLNRATFGLALVLATWIFVAMSPWFSNSAYGFKFTSLGFMAYGTPGEALLLPRPSTTDEIINTDAYTQLLDAFLKGQLNIDVPADPRLEYLDNTYDHTERMVKDIPFLFDRAYYHGKFYPYFGVTPLFLIYLPIYLITGMVPAMALATYSATLMALWGLHLGSSRLTELFVSQVNPLLFFILKLTFYGASFMFLVQVIFSFYALPYLTCCLCLGLLLWTLPSVLRLTQADLTQANPKQEVASWREQLSRYAPLVLMGLSIVGIAGARPILLAFVLCLVPPAALFLWRSPTPLKVKLYATLAVGVPVVAGAIALMAYNYLRFEAITEFGQFKQFTSLDNNQGHFQWSFEFIKAALFHGFCENFMSSAQFPYVESNATINESLGNISQSGNASRVGILAFPYFWLLPLVVLLVQRSRRSSFRHLLVWSLVATIAVAPVCQVIGAFSAGMTLRYVADYAMMWTYVVLLATLQLNFADTKPESDCEVGAGAVNFKALSYLAVLALCLVTLVEHSFLLFSSDNNAAMETIFAMHPELWVLLSRIFAPLSVAF